MVHMVLSHALLLTRYIKPPQQYYEHVEEAEWHVEAVKEFMPGVPVCASLAINEESDVHGVPTGECGVRLARAGADVVGINCHFDPFRCLAATKEMVTAVRKAGFDKVYILFFLPFFSFFKFLFTMQVERGYLKLEVNSIKIPTTYSAKFCPKTQKLKIYK